MIKLDGITKSFKDVDVLKGIDLTVNAGEFVAVTGRSGSGKSTLLKCMGGLMPPSGGKVTVMGEDLYSKKDGERCAFRNKNIGYVFQSFALEDKYRGEENIEIPLIISRVPRVQRTKLVKDTAEFMGISELLRKKTELLSGGEKQRIAIARAIINRPKIIFADEPCGNLDRLNSEIIISIFRGLARQGYTVVMVTHQVEDAAKTDRIITLSDGKISL